MKSRFCFLGFCLTSAHRFGDVTTRAIRINILDAKACPVLSDVKFYESCNR